jgi:hypothetical protein
MDKPKIVFVDQHQVVHTAERLMRFKTLDDKWFHICIARRKLRSSLLIRSILQLWIVRMIDMDTKAYADHVLSQGGGPAFPVPIKDDVCFMGITVRDYFAANEKTYPPNDWILDHFSKPSWFELTSDEVKQAMAAWRFEMADAMLAQRKS